MAMSSSKTKKDGKKLRVPDQGAWTFKTPQVASTFDAHVREQLPWYELATGIVAHVVRHYVPRGGLVVDVGASTGNIGRALASTLSARAAELLAIDDSPDMRAHYDAPGTLVVIDATDFGWNAMPRQADAIVCFLALMFVPVAKRGRLLADMKAALSQGGALVVFDKTEPGPGYVGTISYRLALAAKHENGASADEVIAKELSLAGVQRPMSPAELAGFVEVFRFGDFAGFVYERPASRV